MYTESFAGDVDGILAAMAQWDAYEAQQAEERAFLSRGPVELYIPTGRGKPGRYGLTKTQKTYIGASLMFEIFGSTRDFPHPVTFVMDGGMKIIVHNKQQAINLYHKLTGNSIFGGKRKGKNAL